MKVPVAARSLFEIQCDIEAIDESVGDTLSFEDWKVARQPLIDELEAWHSIPVGYRY